MAEEIIPIHFWVDNFDISLNTSKCIPRAQHRSNLSKCTATSDNISEKNQEKIIFESRQKTMHHSQN